MKILNSRIQLRRDTYENWVQYNPILLSGELGCAVYRDGTTEIRIGDGKSHFIELPRFVASDCSEEKNTDKIEYIDFDKI